MFIRFIPSFYRFWKKWRIYPGHLDFALRQYIGAICELSGGKLSSLNYSKTYIVDVITENFCDGCDLKEGTK